MAPHKNIRPATLPAHQHTDGTTSSAFGEAEKTAATLDDDEGFADFEFPEELNFTLSGAESAAGTILEADVTDADSTPATIAKEGVSTVAGGTAGSPRYPLVFDQRSYNSVLDEYVLDGCVLGLEEEEEEWDAEFDEEGTAEEGTAEPQMALQQDETFWVGEETGPEMPAVWADEEVEVEVEVGMMAELEPWVVEMGVEMDFDQFINIEMLAGEEATLPLRPLKRKGTAVGDEREQKMVRVE
ncbi:hypothetical protein LTR27_005234 [Elasticomyces elasticus]|nr:hypothetical protein LTR27_005234 [Elasticomyces elasticus]